MQEYLIDLNGAAAARRAEYSEKTAAAQASRLLTNVNVQNAIQEGFKKIAKRNKKSVDWVLGGFIEVSERCMQRVPVMVFDKEEKKYVQVTNPDTGEGMWTFNAMGANKALENIGRHLGMFNDKLAVDHSGEIKSAIAAYSDEELAKRQAALDAAIGDIKT